MIDACQKAVDCLQNRQCAWGEFPADCYCDRELTSDAVPDSSPFATTFALDALQSATCVVDGKSISLGIDFLKSETDKRGLVRYWSSRNHKPIDPDLDDTACVAYTLGTHGIVVDNLAAILENQLPEGLFKTWIRDSESDNDVDVAVNANVLRYLTFLQLQGEHGARVSGHLDDAIDRLSAALNLIIGTGRELEASWYYLDVLSVHYFIARAYRDECYGLAPCLPMITEKTLHLGLPKLIETDAVSGAMALAVVSVALEAVRSGCDQLIKYTAALERAQAEISASIINCQRPDGSWPPRAFYGGPEPPSPHRVWWASAELTTAICLDALNRLDRCA